MLGEKPHYSTVVYLFTLNHVSKIWHGVNIWQADKKDKIALKKLLETDS